MDYQVCVYESDRGPMPSGGGSYCVPLTGPLTLIRPAMVAEWSRILPLTACCLLCSRHVRKEARQVKEDASDLGLAGGFLPLFKTGLAS